MKSSLDYYTEQFGPFQFRQLHVAPDYNNFAQSIPGNIAYSDAAGFIFDTRRPKKADLVT